MKVSIVIPTYQNGELLWKCIKSIVEHTEVPYEIILEDNSLENRGFPISVNCGIKRTIGDYIFIFNDDAEVVKSGWLKLMINEFKKDSKIGIVGTQYKMPIGDSDYEWTGFMLVKKEVFENVGLFDERYVIGMYEDIDFCVRVQKMGYKIVCPFKEGELIKHKGSVTLLKLANVELLKEQNRKAFEKKWDENYDLR